MGKNFPADDQVVFSRICTESSQFFAAFKYDLALFGNPDKGELANSCRAMPEHASSIQEFVWHGYFQDITQLNGLEEENQGQHLHFLECLDQVIVPYKGQIIFETDDEWCAETYSKIVWMRSAWLNLIPCWSPKVTVWMFPTRNKKTHPDYSWWPWQLESIILWSPVFGRNHEEPIWRQKQTIDHDARFWQSQTPERLKKIPDSFAKWATKPFTPVGKTLEVFGFTSMFISTCWTNDEKRLFLRNLRYPVICWLDQFTDIPWTRVKVTSAFRGQAFEILLCDWPWGHSCFH